jgi:hypothetical protein
MKMEEKRDVWDMAAEEHDAHVPHKAKIKSDLGVGELLHRGLTLRVDGQTS